MNNFRWILRMAVRDSRRNRGRLFLFVASIILGIAALVAIYSLGENLRNEVDRQAAGLLGADLELQSNRPLPPSLAGLPDSLGDRRSEERSFASMVVFPKGGGTRLVQVRALGGDFPYYGELETVPAGSGRTFRRGRAALVDKTLLLQFGAQVGDSVRVGALTFIIAGSLERAPGGTGLSASVSPPVYIPLRYLPATGLEQKGSRINYKYFFKWDTPIDVQALAEGLEDRLDGEGVDWETVESQKQDTARSFTDLTRFLSLVGFIALLLGCIGVTSAVQLYVREKITTVAILRCLGTSARTAILIYLVQIAVIGLLGAVAGAAIGVGIQQLLPRVVQDFLPITLEPSLSVAGIAQGLLAGLGLSLLFALLPLMAIRHISPLNTIRLTVTPTRKRDLWRWAVILLVVLFIAGFIYLQVGEWPETLAFTGGLLAAFGLLSALAWALIRSVRKWVRPGWSYLLRQGLSNLYRPNNQTQVLVVSIGLGTALIVLLLFVQGLLLDRVQFSASGNQPNMVLFDIQTPQREGVLRLAQSSGLPLLRTVPIVNMRLERVRDITPARLVADSTLELQRWIFEREYRVTFRDSLTSSEKVVAGSWAGRTPASGAVPISLEAGFAERNGIRIGDTLHFNVQGAPLQTVVGSLREVDWNRIQTNFLVVFPSGVLEEAPQFHVLLTRVESPEVSARFQQAVVQAYPNVSVIDLGLILEVLDELLGKIGFVIRFMAGFSILTGVIVLIGSVLISKYQRIAESVLLRTLGGRQRQILYITALEYFFLGLLSALTGFLLALGGAWALARFSFEVPFRPNVGSALLVVLGVCLLTVVIGLFNIRPVLQTPPLAVLRDES